MREKVEGPEERAAAEKNKKERRQRLAMPSAVCLQKALRLRKFRKEPSLRGLPCHVCDYGVAFFECAKVFSLCQTAYEHRRGGGFAQKIAEHQRPSRVNPQSVEAAPFTQQTTRPCETKGFFPSAPNRGSAASRLTEEVFVRARPRGGSFQALGLGLVEGTHLRLAATTATTTPPQQQPHRFPSPSVGGALRQPPAARALACEVGERQ